MARPDINTNGVRVSLEKAREQAQQSLVAKKAEARQREIDRAAAAQRARHVQGAKSPTTTSFGSILKDALSDLPKTVKGEKGRFVSVKKILKG